MDYREENIMDWKTFLRKSVQVGLGSSGMSLFVKGGASAQTTDEHTKREQKFKRRLDQSSDGEFGKAFR